MGPNQHYKIPSSFKDFGRRFVLQYPYYEKELPHNITDELSLDRVVKQYLANKRNSDESIIPVQAPEEIVVAVAKQSAIFNAPTPHDDTIEKTILRTGDYWNDVFIEEVDPSNILRTKETPKVAGPKPVQGGRGNFRNLASTQEEEDAFDYVKYRNVPKPTGFSSCPHRSYIEELVSPACHIQTWVKLQWRVVPIRKWHGFRDSLGYPDLRVYLACMIPPIILICLITHLKWLAPFSIGANIVVLIIIFTAVYYAFVYNPTFTGLVPITKLYSYFEFVGMSVFSMSCSGVVIPIENNMANPKKYPIVLCTGMSLIICCTFLVSFFGYSAFLENCESPITVNFPMTTGPKILKVLIVVMIYITHALNFWVPFNLCFYYLKFLHPEQKHLMWELIYRAIFVAMIGCIAIVFPNINALMGFLGTFCLSNMAFIWPNIIYLLTNWERPGLGKYYWRLWKSLFLILIGCFLLLCGSVVNINELMSVFR